VLLSVVNIYINTSVIIIKYCTYEPQHIIFILLKKKNCLLRIRIQKKKKKKKKKKKISKNY